MPKPKLQRFSSIPLLFTCPICRADLALQDQSLICPQRHSYDLSKFGYVNLAPQAKASDDYDKSSFQQRHLILERGFYQPILEKIQEILIQYAPQRILDIGCGEGYYARHLQHDHDWDIYAFDLSKDSIQLAAKQDQTLAVKWFVADLAHLPLQDQSIEAILDIYSPANYAEFNRVLADQGFLIKVVPGNDHLKEIRGLAKEQLRQKDYSNQQVLEHFDQHFNQITAYSISHTQAITDEERKAFLAMTPLLFHVDQSLIDWSQLTQITIAATILVGKKKQPVTSHI